MRILVLLIVLCSQLLAQSDNFVGKWEIAKNPATGRANITVNIQRSGELLGGSMVFVNPDGSLLKSEIKKAVISGSTLSFETILANEPSHWSLTLNRNGQTALLRGQDGEMLIREKMTKSR